MNGKLISILASLAFLAGCQTASVQSAPKLPKSLADKVADCSFSVDNREGVAWNCKNQVKLSVEEAMKVEAWARAKDQEIQLSGQPPVVFSLFDVNVNSGYPNYITRGRYDRRLYGGSHDGYYRYSYEGRLGTSNVDRYNAHQEHSSCLQRQKWERNSGVRHPRRC
ncbi:hypothetical protein HQ403_02300 [Candidatus Kaiserbacteria bacterium]|nr:hypothetical protein [Candidatus Kaiserbacteria bacterium]